MNLAPYALSIAPFAIFIFLLFTKKASLLKTSFATLVIATLLAVFYWQIFPSSLFESYAKGTLVALDIFLIIFGAIFFLEVLTDLKIIESIIYYLESISKDYRVQVIILAWFFENFIEGTAGFGTPSAVVAPLLAGLGLSPITAVIVSLLGNSTSVVFGAAGAPIRTGFAGLNTAGVGEIASIINLIGIIVPVFMLLAITAGKKDRWIQFKECLPFALWSGAAFVIPSAIFAKFGDEFPSIISSIVGLLIIFVSLKIGFLTPKKIRRVKSEPVPKASISFLKSAFPYLLLIILLVAGKIFIGGMSVPIKIGSIVHKLNLFNPGLAFIIAGLPIAIFWNKRKKLAKTSAIDSAKRSFEPFLVVACMSAFVQLITMASQNSSGMESPIELISKIFENRFLPFIAPFAGMFGSFLTGSATISNIMFGGFLSKAAGIIGLSSIKILALALVGAAAGNMIALADILSAEAVLKLKHKERDVIKGVIIPSFIYVAIAGIIGMFIA